MTDSRELWRLCRLLANRPRLNLLWLLFSDGELCVSDAQVLSGMSRPNASNQLKAMNMQGLISFRRKNMNVIYRAAPVFPDGMASQVLPALRVSYVKATPFPEIIRIATAFSHGRRIELARAIGKRRVSFDLLLKKTGMSRTALFRHLDKLERRGFVSRDPSGYALICPDCDFAKILLDLAVA